MGIGGREMVREFRLAWDDDEFISAGGQRQAPRHLDWDADDSPPEPTANPPLERRSKTRPTKSRVRRTRDLED